MLGGPATAGDITVTADYLSFADTTNVQSTGALTIQPRTASTAIGIGGGAGDLRLVDSELGKLADGFSSITIGDLNSGTGTVDMEPYVGKWIGKATIPEDADHPAAGKEVTIPVTTKWILNRNVLVANWKAVVNGETINQGKWLWWWDTKTKQIRALSVMTMGAYGESIWTKQGDKWVGKWNGATEKGEDSLSVVTTSFDGPDTIIHEWTRQKRGDKPQPDYREEFKRVKSK